MRSANEVPTGIQGDTKTKAGKSMRRMVMMAGVLAAILAIGGCAFNGPSKADVASVRESLSDVPQDWTLSYVDGNNSSTEGLSRDLSIGVTRHGDIAADDLVTLIGAVVDAVPSGARYRISIMVSLDSADSPSAQLGVPAMELGLYDNGIAGAADHGEIYATRSQLKAVLDGRS